uniref:ERAP1-like C-terminal domain-containing protein n=1 Tax=Daphnia galeata TaxID=27404 RepID=A0A8J2W9H3_9CRUS|nr:unnamed protein product [Daphnia galeata]
MTCTEKPWILAKMLEMSINSKSGIRKQNAAIVISDISRNSLGRYMVFNFIRDRLDDLFAVFPGSSFRSISRILKAVASSLNTEIELKELIGFREVQKSGGLSGSERAIQQSIDQAKNNVNWMKQNYQHVLDWLQRVY